VAPACGWWVGGFGLEQADAEESAVLVDALDHVSVELELADDDGGKVNPTGAQLIERHWLLARVPELLKHPKLLGFNERHRPDSLAHSRVPKQLASAPPPWVASMGEMKSAWTRPTPEQ
jgi:hypothetical protein